MNYDSFGNYNTILILILIACVLRLLTLTKIMIIKLGSLYCVTVGVMPCFEGQSKFFLVDHQKGSVQIKRHARALR